MEPVRSKKTVSRDCLQNFRLHFMSLLTVPVVKNSHILARIYFIFLKERPKPNSKVLQWKIWTLVEIVWKEFSFHVK